MKSDRDHLGGCLCFELRDAPKVHILYTFTSCSTAIFMMHKGSKTHNALSWAQGMLESAKNSNMLKFSSIVQTGDVT